MKYTKHILRGGPLPLADEGWETPKPPLYYLVCAVVLKCAGLAATSFDGAVALRLLSLAISAVQLFFVFRSLRLLFPSQHECQMVGLVLAGFLPMQIYLMQYVTNENLLAF